MKTKNLFFGMLAMAGMLFATSCSQDEVISGSSAGELVDATFTIATEDGIGTRAIGDGTTVDKVACAVYDADGKELKELGATKDIVGKKATFETRLVKGKKYQVAFFAYNSEAEVYNVSDLKNITVNKVNNEKPLSNDERCDAFTGNAVVEATNEVVNQTVYLKRPFAQLNLGIDGEELQAAKNAGIVIAKSKITVSNVYSAFNALENDVTGNEGDMTFELNAIPGEPLNVTVDGSVVAYNYLAMTYLLVGDNDSEKSLTNVKFYWETASGETSATAPAEFINIPVQRNYRTNIIGKLLTRPSAFEIIIDEKFDGEEVVNKVMNVYDLQAALDAVKEGQTKTISLGADIQGNVVDVQKPGRKVTIDGAGYKYNGQIKVHSNSNYYEDAALTIKNVNFETSTAGVNVIEAVENGSERYSSNITIEKCVFTATGDAVNTAVAVQVKAARNVTIKSCIAENMHSLIQAQSCDTGDVVVMNSVVSGKNGVAFKQVKKAVVEGNTISATAYGIRFDGNIDNYGITIKDNNVTAAQPFIVRKMTGKDNTIALEGNNTLNVSAAAVATEAPAYQIVITNGSDDEEYVKPTGTYTLTGADEYYVYPRDYYFPVADWDEFTAALAAGEPKVMFTENITYEGASSYNLKNNVEVNLNDKTFTTGNASTTWLNIMGSKATFKKGIIEGKVYVQKNGGTYSDATFDNVTFGGTITFSSVTQGSLAVQGGNSVYAKNCT